MIRPALGYFSLVNFVTRSALVAPWPLSYLARHLLRALAFWMSLRLSMHDALGLRWPSKFRRSYCELQNRHAGPRGAGGGNPQSELPIVGPGATQDRG